MQRVISFLSGSATDGTLLFSLFLGYEYSHVTKRITLKEENENEHSFSESVRLYSPEEALALLDSGRFHVERIIGDYDGGLFDATTSPRMMLLARLSQA